MSAFGDAFDYLLHERVPEENAEPVGGDQVLDLIADHLELSLVADGHRLRVRRSRSGSCWGTPDAASSWPRASRT